jgi:hypothetical protein
LQLRFSAGLYFGFDRRADRAVGLVWLLIQKARSPKMLPTMKTSMDEIDLKFTDVKDAS